MVAGRWVRPMRSDFICEFESLAAYAGNAASNRLLELYLSIATPFVSNKCPKRIDKILRSQCWFFTSLRHEEVFRTRDTKIEGIS